MGMAQLRPTQGQINNEQRRQGYLIHLKYRKKKILKEMLQWTAR